MFLTVELRVLKLIKENEIHTR